MRKILFLIIASFFMQSSFAQDFSNKGKDFWVGYGNHVQMFPFNPTATTNVEKMQIYLTSDVSTTGNITISSIGFSQAFTVTANLVTVVDIPRTAALPDEGLYNHGIHITALKPIVAYGFIYFSAISGATVYLPTNTLGKEYYSLNYRQLSNQANSFSYFFVEATESGSTIVEITPSKITKGGWPANVTQTITLTQGQIYQVLSATDLTGSTIKSIASGTGGCKKIAVFCGSGKISTGCAVVGSTSTAVGSSDNLYQQMYPTSTWGKKYILVPSQNKQAAATPVINKNIFRIFRPDPSALVTLNGVILSPASFINNSYDFESSQTNLVESSKGILVAQYFTSANAGGCPSGNANPHDPEMIYLNPVEQTVTDVTVNSMQPASNTNITQHFINVVLRNAGTGVSSFKIDGVLPPASSFTVLPQDNNYSYARIWKNGGSITPTDPPLSLGAHRLTCDSGFNAIAYGFGSAESYGYSAGTNLKDLYQQISVQSQFGIETAPSICTNSPFRFRVSLPYCADSVQWNLSSLPGPPVPTNPKIIYTSCVPGTGGPDSTTVVNGRVIYWYSLPSIYTFGVAGIYPITITAYNTGATLCGSSQDIEFDLGVYDPPIAGFSYNQPGCMADTVRFLDTTLTPKPNYQWFWNFGDPGSGVANTSSLQNPKHVFSTTGIHNVTLTTITTVGCFSGTASTPVNIPVLVNATLTGTTAVCQNDPPPNINFTITPGLAPYKINYTLSINGGATVAQTPITTSTLLNPFSVPTGTAGIYTYDITSIENPNAAFCTNTITGQTVTVTVNPLPTATISGTTNVCQNSPSPNVTFTGSGGSTAATIYQFTYIPVVNGVAGAAQTINSNAAGIAMISVSTATVGTYSYDLISVSDVGTTCVKTLTAGATTNATVFVQATPTGTVVSDNAIVCQDGTAPTIVFTGSGANGQAPYTFTYTITTNGIVGPVQTISSIGSSNSTAPISVPMGTAGTIIYTLLSVQNSGAINCITNYTAATAPTTTITINPVPSATISGTTTVCQAGGPQTITFIGAGGVGQYLITYSINGVTQTPPLTTVGNTATVSVPVTTFGAFVYEIESVTDISTSCIKTYIAPNKPIATVIVQATSTATISPVTMVVCQDVTAPTVTFTAANGIAPFTFTYTVTTNGVTGSAQTIVSNPLSSNSASLSIPMTTAGTLVYTLLSVSNTGAINCTSTVTGQTATFTINPIPSATITGTTTVCQNIGTQPITFIGTGGLGASYDFNYTLNGVAQPTLTGNNIIINQPTTAFGIFAYVITSVKDNSTGCTKTYSTVPPTAVVSVKQLATATIATSAAIVCQASITSPVITFTALGGEAPYKFNYTITFNGVTGGIQTTPFSASGNSYQLTLPTTTPGTYVYSLVSVLESSTANCVNAQTGSTQVIIHPKPTASFTTVGPYCQQKSVLITPAFGITPTGTVVSWVWDYGDGNGPQIRPNGNPFTLTYPTAGIKIITFKTISDNGCVSDLFTLPVTIFSRPKAGFINPAACLADALAQFTDTSTVAGVGASIVFWAWDFGDGSPIFAGTGPTYQNPAHAYAAVGQKTVTLIVTSNSGCKDTVIQQFFINGEVTRAAFTTLNPNNLCSNRPVQIRENSLVNVGGLIRTDIYWDYLGTPTIFDQDNSPTPNKIYTHNYPNLQIDKLYKVRYFAYSGFNGVCQKDTLIDILVRASPVATFISVPDVCLNGGPVTLNQGSAAGGVGVYMGPGVTFAGGVYTFNPLATGVVLGTNNSVVYTVTSPTGCDSAKVQQIKVLAPPVVNTFTTVGNLCHNNAITFHNTYTNGDGTVIKWIYNWNDATPIQTMTTGADVTHVYTTTGSHTATLTLETGYGCRNIPFPVTFIVNPLPVPSYNPSPSVCLPLADVLFTNTTPNVGSNTYQWSFDLPSTTPANTSTLTSPNHIYTTQGPFNTHLIATNIATGCIDSTVIIVINSSTIHPAPVLQFNTIPDVCLNNGTVSFASYTSETSGIAGGPGIFTCAVTPTAISSNGTFNPIIAGVGTHVITYTWTSTFNCPTSINKNVKVLAPPVVNTFTTLGNTCENNSIIFQNTVTQGDGIINTWVYDWGDGTANTTATNGNDVTHTYLLPNTYTATLYVITDGLCKSAPPLSLQVVVNPLPRPDFTYTDTTCLPQAKVTFINTTPNIGNWAYNWNLDFPSTLPADQSTQVTNVPYTYTSLTPTHSVKLTATSPTTGCTLSKIKTINGIHPAPVASFNFNKPSVCLAQNVTVLDNSTFADGSPLKWSWNFGESNSNQIGQTQPPYTYSTANTFNVKLTITNSFGCTDDTIRPFTVYPYAVINAGSDNFVLEGGSIILQGTATGNNLTYLWTANPLPTYLNVNNILNPIASPKVDVTYILSVTAQGGCTNADSVFIKVLKFPQIPNTFTPNNDGVHDFWEIKYLYTYPGNRVQVFTRTGQLVFESKGYAKPWDGTMNGKSLPFDTYYYIIEPGTGRQPLTGYVTIVK